MPRSRPLQILVVEDDVDFADGLAEVCEQEGHIVEVVYSGEQGIERFGRGGFDIAFMDIRLPGRNGVDSFLEIRRRHPQAAVVMMTGFRVEELIEQAMAQGAWSILRKPFPAARVLEILERLRPRGVLVVDDDRDFVDGLRELLVENGWNVFTAHNGEEALRKLVAHRPDAMVLDLRMSPQSGVEVCREAARRGCAVPTILVSGDTTGDAEALPEVAVGEIRSILCKPFPAEELLAALETCVPTRERPQ